MKIISVLQKNWLSILIILMPYIAILYFWNDLPDPMPGHWNFKGEIDGYHPKYWLLFYPLISLFVLGIVNLVSFIDPKKQTEHFEKVILWIGFYMSLFMSGIIMVVMFIALGYSIQMEAVVFYSIILLFLVLGNMFGKFRPNYFVGIRTPWTLESELVWMKTHRYSGKLWVFSSLAMLVCKWILPAQVFLVLFVIYLFSLILIPVIYSYVKYRELGE